MALQSNYVAFDTPQFRKLSDDQMERLHHASLEILDRTGVRLNDQEALHLMKQARVKLVDESLVHIPPGLVEWALSLAPKLVVLCDRGGLNQIELIMSREPLGCSGAGHLPPRVFCSDPRLSQTQHLHSHQP